MGVARTEKSVSFQGIEILRLEEDKIVERWGEWNAEDILQQLGALK
jgi:predicted ester cyclase